MRWDIFKLLRAMNHFCLFSRARPSSPWLHVFVRTPALDTSAGETAFLIISISHRLLPLDFFLFFFFVISSSPILWWSRVWLISAQIHLEAFLRLVLLILQFLFGSSTGVRLRLGTPSILLSLLPSRVYTYPGFLVVVPFLNLSLLLFQKSRSFLVAPSSFLRSLLYR